MSLPNSSALRENHSCQGGRGGRPGGGLVAVVSAAVSARAIPPTLASAQLVLHQQQLLNRGGVLARYPPWHIPHLPGP